MIGRALLITMAALWLGGCSTIRPAAPPGPGALEYREVQGEIQRQQTELAMTGAKIEEDSREIVGEIAALEIALADPDYDREILINQVHDLRVMAENHQADAETLNRQLAEEREATRRQGEIFNEREEAWQRALSEREMENTALEVDNTKLTGQRNMILVISIALGLVIVGSVVIRVLRVLRIIPV